MYISKSKHKKVHEQIFYVYKTTCIITNEYYIGMHKTYNINAEYFGSGIKIIESIKKYGAENHIKEILCYCLDKDELKEKEKEFLTKETIKDPLCLNMIPGGTGGYNLSLEQRRELSKKSHLAIKEKEKNDPEYRKKHSKNISIALRKAYQDGLIPPFTGKKHTEETRKKQSISAIGKHDGKLNSQYGTCWIVGYIL